MKPTILPVDNEAAPPVYGWMLVVLPHPAGAAQLLAEGGEALDDGVDPGGAVEMPWYTYCVRAAVVVEVDQAGLLAAPVSAAGVGAADAGAGAFDVAGATPLPVTPLGYCVLLAGKVIVAR